MKNPRLKCFRCGGMKYVGDPYYAFGVYYVDVTCLSCSHSKDIEVERLNKFLTALRNAMKGQDVNEKAST